MHAMARETEPGAHELKSWMRGCSATGAAGQRRGSVAAATGTSAPSRSAEPRNRSERTAAARGRSHATTLRWRTCAGAGTRAFAADAWGQMA